MTEPEAGTVGTVSIHIDFQEPKPEPEPLEPLSRNRNRNRPFLLDCAEASKTIFPRGI